MRHGKWLCMGTALAVPLGVMLFGARAQEKRPSSYAPVVIHEEFEKTVARMEAAKPEIEARQASLLRERYDLEDRPAKGVAMSRGKPIQEGCG